MGPAYQRSYEHLEAALSGRLSRAESDQVQRAHALAERAHAGQMRDEGTPYIIHPLRVAIILADELKMFSPTLISGALLHDVIEDSDTTREQIAEGFGEQVAEIVWLLTKFEDVPLGAYLAAIERAAGTGAAIVKLCDRLDNLRFMAHSTRAEKKRRYVRTTAQYYIPMAARINSYLHDQLAHSLDEARRHVSLLNR